MRGSASTPSGAPPLSPPWLDAAGRDLGLREIVGSKHEPRIVKFFADAGHPYVKDDETAWCAAFVAAKLQEVGVPSTKKLNARSYLDWGRKLEKPIEGCIVVLRRGSSSWQGHVGFYLRQSAGRVFIRGGNQRNAVSDEPYLLGNVLGYRWPLGVPTPAASASSPMAPAKAAPRLQIGSTGADVKRWQGLLNALRVSLPLPLLVEDGRFGPHTREATVRFQEHRYLPLDGVVDAVDWAAAELAAEALG